MFSQLYLRTSSSQYVRFYTGVAPSPGRSAKTQEGPPNTYSCS